MEGRRESPPRHPSPIPLQAHSPTCRMTRMSEKRMAASRLYRRTGCIVHSVTSMGSSSICRKFLPRAFLYALYSGRWRPERG